MNNTAIMGVSLCGCLRTRGLKFADVLYGQILIMTEWQIIEFKNTQKSSREVKSQHYLTLWSMDLTNAK